MAQGLWSMAHFVYNSGRSRGEAWEAQAPSYFQTKLRPNPKGQKNFLGDWDPPLSHNLDDRVPPPPYLKVWIRHCIIIQLLLTCASKAFACLAVLVEGKFQVFQVSKSSISSVLLQRMKQNINYQTTQCKNGFPMFNTGKLSFLLLSFFFYWCFFVNVLCSCLWCAVPDPLI